MDLVSVIIPAYRAERFLHFAVRSVLAQTYQPWEAVIVADDMQDYAALLKQHGIADARLKFCATGKIGSGITPARNVGLKYAAGNIIATLDADDVFLPEKLALAVPKAKEYGLVSTALIVKDAAGKFLRNIGDKAAEGMLPASRYKTVNFSMDSMVVFSRDVIPATYDEEILFMEDLSFLLKCFEYAEGTYHIPTPLHVYTKQPDSVSYRAEAHKRFHEMKLKMIADLSAGKYVLKDKKGAAGICDFLQKSLEAETQLALARQKNPDILFEDVVEKMVGDERLELPTSSV